MSDRMIDVESVVEATNKLVDAVAELVKQIPGLCVVRAGRADNVEIQVNPDVFRQLPGGKAQASESSNGEYVHYHKRMGPVYWVCVEKKEAGK